MTTKVTAANYAKVAQALNARFDLNCRCEPYVDVKTYQDWQASELQVQRGQRALRIEGLPPLFCRCQVSTSKTKKGE